ncbi:GntR family transcriptional regulator [Paenibacillus abyssi]|uniref:Transcriptional regulator n=1 Tax=Paenibacillus abyssi TaxID=1340531 RepID=A0A917CYF8_9BACL|nr:GntR family transcriptional regulator [Paenibacillus abyssi]GGG04418.1 transcriptional regulator [Paenibacillus abyssi]
MLELEMIKPDAGQSAREYAYQLLRDHIIRLKLKPGQPLSENELAAKLQISRTPVREALIRLSQEQLLEVLPQRGTYVSLIDLEQVEEARFVREQLEPAVVRLACGRFTADQRIQLESNLILFEKYVEEKDYSKLFDLDIRFHEILFTGSGKERTWAIVHSLNAHLSRIRMLSLASEYNWTTIIAQHREVVEAIKTKDADRGERVMREHVSLIVLDQEALIRAHPDYFKNSPQGGDT